jgi:UDP-N-acetylmuramoyl-L-alanyl-D-glutamate--2,6-diaminopimelate ligase
VPKISVLNHDDPSFAYFAAIPADQKISYGMQSSADVHAKQIIHRPDGLQFDLILWHKVIGDAGVMFSSLVGEFNVYNILAAIATAKGLDRKIPVQIGIEHVKGISGRMERIYEGQHFTAMVDFAHTPNALAKALAAAKTMLEPGKRLIAVFGSAGLRDVQKRRMMAETSARLADMTILTAEDPRTESLEAILEMMAQGCVSQGGIEGQTFIRVADRGDAIYQACQMAQPGDIVMACGKGHEQSMCFGTIEYPWDDRAAMRAALRGMPLKTLPTAENRTE